MELPATAIDAILALWPVADLATIGGDGRPHLVPIVFARTGDRLWSPIDGKPKAGRELARVRNLRRDPRATLLLQHYAAVWQRLWWLRLECEAEIMSIADPPAGEAAGAIEALRAKYPEYARVPVLAAGSTALRFTIGTLRSWRASSEAGVVEPSGIEPPTSALRTQRSPN